MLIQLRIQMLERNTLLLSSRARLGSPSSRSFSGSSCSGRCSTTLSPSRASVSIVGSSSNSIYICTQQTVSFSRATGRAFPPLRSDSDTHVYTELGKLVQPMPRSNSLICIFAETAAGDYSLLRAACNSSFSFFSFT